MAFFRAVPRRCPSRLIALATVAAALAAVPATSKAEVTYDWLGGNHDNFSDANWNYPGGNADLGTGVTFNFGASSNGNDLPLDANGLVNCNIHSSGNDGDAFKSLNFARQAWTMTGNALITDTGGSINVAASSPGVTIANAIHMKEYGISGNTPYMDLRVATNLTITGLIDQLSDFSDGYNVGTLNKYGDGTVTLTNANSYTGGTNVFGGRLIDYYAHGNYNDSAALEFHTNTSQTYGGTIFGAGSFTKSGASILTLSGAVYYTGATTVNEGRLILNNLLSTSSFAISDGAALEFNLAGTQTLNKPVTGDGALVKSGVGTLTLSGLDTQYGGTTVNAGKLIDLNPHGAYVTNAALELRNADAVILSGQGGISGSGSLVKSGAGVLTVSGDTYTGGTTVNAGRLTDFDPHGDYVTNAALEFRTATDLSYSGLISGSGSFTKSAYATLTLTSANTYTGGTTVNEGRLVDQIPHGNYVTDADLEFANATDVTLQTSIPVGPPSFSSISGTGNLTKSGAGQLTMGLPNSYAGSTTVSGGVLIGVSSDNVLPTGTDLTVNTGGAYVLWDDRRQTVASLSGAGEVLLGHNSLFTINGSADTTFSGVIFQSGALTKSGAGTLTLTGVNTYTGGTTVSSGHLIDQNPHGDYATSSVLEFQTAGDLTYAGVVSGHGGLYKSGSGTLTLTGGNLYGTSVIEEGGLRLGRDDALMSGSTMIMSAGTVLDLDGHTQELTNPIGPGEIKLGASTGKLVVTPSTDLPYEGTITGAGTFTKSGTSTLTLTGQNTYTGGTTVGAGTLVDQSPHGDYAVAQGATVEFRSAADGRYDGVVSGAGSFTKDGAGTLTRSQASANAQGTLVLAGTLVDLHPSGRYDDKATIEFAPAADLSFAGSDVQGYGTFVKAGAGTLTLTSAIDPHIAERIAAGTLKGAASSFRSDVSSTGGTLRFDEPGSGSFDSTYSGAGALLKSGSGTTVLRNAPANTGGVEVSAGTLEADGRGTMAEGLAVDAGATFLNRSGGVLAVAGRSSNQGVVSTFSGATTDFTGLVSGAGGFAGAGTVRLDGGYGPGDGPASVSFAGGLTLGATNTLTMELGGTTPGTGYDHLTVAGSATLGGALDVAYYGGFVASAGQSFDLFDLAQEAGAFSSVSLPALGQGLAWDASALYTTGVVRVQSVPEPAALLPLGLGALALLRRRR